MIRSICFWSLGLRWARVLGDWGLEKKRFSDKSIRLLELFERTFEGLAFLCSLRSSNSVLKLVGFRGCSCSTDRLDCMSFFFWAGYGLLFGIVQLLWFTVSGRSLSAEADRVVGIRKVMSLFVAGTAGCLNR